MSLTFTHSATSISLLERQRQEEEEAELYSKLHYAEHFELEEAAQNDTKDSFETLDENIDNDLAASKDIDIKYHDPAAQADGPGSPEISRAYSTINHAHPSGSEAGRTANKEKSILDIAPCTTTDDVQRSILEAKMKSPGMITSSKNINDEKTLISFLLVFIQFRISLTLKGI